MPDDNNREDLKPDLPKHADGASPEPPPSWKRPETDYEQPYEQMDRQNTERRNESQQRPSMPHQLSQTDVQLLENARRNISIAQICAIVSLFLGGVVLSTVAVVLAIMGLSKLNAYANTHSLEQDAQRALRRPGMLAVGMCVFALVFNIVSLILFYPVFMEAVQTGNFSGLFGSGQGGAPSPGAGSSTWG